MDCPGISFFQIPVLVGICNIKLQSIFLLVDMLFEKNNSSALR